jgi:hypothetical protein
MGAKCLARQKERLQQEQYAESVRKQHEEIKEQYVETLHEHGMDFEEDSPQPPEEKRLRTTASLSEPQTALVNVEGQTAHREADRSARRMHVQTHPEPQPNRHAQVSESQLDMARHPRLQAKYRKATEEITYLKNECQKYADMYNQLDMQANNLWSEHQNARQRLEILNQEVTAHKTQIKAMEHDNEQLRGYIATMRSAQDPICDEDHYVRGFEGLRRNIDSWVAKQYKLNSKQALRDSCAYEIVELISRLGEHGAKAGNTLQGGKYSIRSLYRERRTRIPLIRHIIAIHLFHEIFYPFAFGLPAESDHYSKSLEQGILHESRIHLWHN